jgi:hypothetical protein
LTVDIFAVFNDDVDDETKNIIIKFLNPKKIIWLKDDINLYKNKNTNFNPSFYLMYNKISICNNLKKDYEIENNFKYDLNIKTRPDLIINDYIPESIINNINDNTFYSPYLIQFSNDSINNLFGLGLTNDQIFMGSNKIFDILSGIYLEINNPDFKSEFKIPEHYLKKYLNMHNIFINYFNLSVFIEKFNSENNKFYYT